MATIAAKGAASVSSLGWGGDASSNNSLSLSTPAGWHFSWWLLSVAIIIFFLWAL
jgi:hypothetical protein